MYSQRCSGSTHGTERSVALSLIQSANHAVVGTFRGSSLWSVAQHVGSQRRSAHQFFFMPIFCVRLVQAGGEWGCDTKDVKSLLFPTNVASCTYVCVRTDRHILSACQAM